MLDVIFKFGRNMKNWGKSSHIQKHLFSNWSQTKLCEKNYSVYVMSSKHIIGYHQVLPWI